MSEITSKDFLKTGGRHIVKPSGERVYLRGTNAGGWLVHEEWMCPTKAADMHTVRRTLEARFGAEKRDELINVYRDAYWTEHDFDTCATLGMTCIRLPFIYWDIADEDGNLLPNGFARLDWFVENCARRGMYVIPDLHGAYGSQNGKHHSGQENDGRQLYENEANRAKTLKLWEAVALHFRGNPAVAGYDLLNEPENNTKWTGKPQWDYFDELYRAVRAVDNEHIIFFGVCWTPHNIPQPRKYSWKNVVYEYHHYAWGAKTTAAVYLHALGAATWEAIKFRVPSYIGEFTCFGMDNAWRRCLRLYNHLGFHWTTWTYKVTGEGKGDPWWGIYEQNLPQVDTAAASEAEIRAAWTKVGTEHAIETRLYKILAEYLNRGDDYE